VRGRAWPPRRRERKAVSAHRGQGQHGQGQGIPGKSDVMKKDHRKQSERFFFTRWENHAVNVIMITELVLNCVFVLVE
jgi:hypothetical protein